MKPKSNGKSPPTPPSSAASTDHQCGEAEWRSAEFQPPRRSVLSMFSAETAESVANLLIRELAETVDRPSNGGIRLDNSADLEWIMQVINHAFFLPLHNSRDHETVRSAIRIYLSWMSAINAEPHSACPLPMKTSPIKYFSPILDSLRAVFIPRQSPSSHSSHEGTLINRQSNEIRTILFAIRHLYSKKGIREEFKAEVWNRLLGFLLAVCDSSMRKPTYPDELSSVMSADMSEVLLDAWTIASLSGAINPKHYWPKLSAQSSLWITYVPFVEWWAQKLLPLTVIFAQKIYGEDYSDIPIHDERLAGAARSALQREDGSRLLNETWHQLVNLLGNPASFFDRADQLCDEHHLDAALQLYVQQQVGMAFFFAVTAFSRMVDIFFGDADVCLDFHESAELHAQWLEATSRVGEWNRNAHKSSHRLSNLSAASSSTQSRDNNRSSAHSLAASTGAASTIGQSLALVQNHAAAVAGVAKRPIQSSRSGNASQPLSRHSSKSVVHHAVSLATDSMQPPPPPTRHHSVQLNADPLGGAHLSSPPPPPLQPGQYVWYTLKNNPLRNERPKSERRPPSDALLEMFLPWLAAPARIPLAADHRKYSEDVISQKSISSAEIDTQMSAAEVNRRSFAASTASSSDLSAPPPSYGVPPSISHPGAPADPATIPNVDSVAAGRASALGALCRIVCAKTSTERLADDQLAQFFAVLHEALVERDRLMLCALLFHSTELFKLGLSGVEFLLPNYLMAIDLVLTESFKLRLHPSIHEIDMRHVCLRSLASIIAWPTTFGTEAIIPAGPNSALSHGDKNQLQPGQTYIQLRSRIIKNLVNSLRNETDSMNLQLALGLCHSFCAESARYDTQSRCRQTSAVLPERNGQTQPSDEIPEKDFTVSALKRVVSAICDNLCKPAWSVELATSLAAFDCLNAIAALPNAVLFHHSDLSVGSLTVSSLCRFVNAQLQKPPPSHSRDLHSSVVAAFQCLEVWLSAAPLLTEIESCLSTVAQTIEFGMTGGSGLLPADYKPTSQRVHDAAESLQYSLFSSVGSCPTDSAAATATVDEHSVLRKLGDDSISLDRFQHFIVDKSTLLSLHDITHLDFVSKGLPTLVMVARSPYRGAHASLIQLRARPPSCDDAKENCSMSSNDPSPSTPTVIVRKKDSLAVPAIPPPTPIATQQFQFPPMEPRCQLDESMRAAARGPAVDKIERQLEQIHERLKGGAGAAVGDRDVHNVWIQSALGNLLCQPPEPESCVNRCNTIRVFLYDMGLVNRKMYGTDFVHLDSSKNADFYSQLHEIVDRQPAKRCETVSLFYVRAGQFLAPDILRNTENLSQTTSAAFRLFVSQLGKVRTIVDSGFWSGHWERAFAASSSALERHNHGDDDADEGGDRRRDEKHSLDGVQHCLWWADGQLEAAFILPTERTAQRNRDWMNGAECRQSDEFAPAPLKKLFQRTQTRYFSVERCDSVTEDPEHRPLQSPSARLLQMNIDIRPKGELLPLSLQLSDSLRSSCSPPPSPFRGDKAFRLRPTLSVDVSGNVNSASSSPRSVRFSPNQQRTPTTLRRQQTVGDDAANQLDGRWERRSGRRTPLLNTAKYAAASQRATTIDSLSDNLFDSQPNSPTPFVGDHSPIGGFLSARQRAGSLQSSPISAEALAASISSTATIHSAHSADFVADSAKSTPRGSPLRSPRGSISDMSAARRLSATATLSGAVAAFRRPMRRAKIDSPTDTAPQSNPPPPTAANGGGWGYLRSFFRRSDPTAREPAFTTLMEVTEEDLAAMFPRMQSLDKGYTHSSTASSLAGGGIPHSREGSSLNADTDAKRNSDLWPPAHPATTRTRSSSTINSEMGTQNALAASQRPTPHPMLNSERAHCTQPTAKRSADQRVVVIWLERFEDMDSFPYDQLLSATDDGARRCATKAQRSDLHLIFLHSFEAGLVRVHCESVWTKAGQPGPLVDGVVVSTAVLPQLLRQTVANIARRKAVEVDQPPNSYRRRQAIADLSKRFASQLGYTEFLDRFIAI